MFDVYVRRKGQVLVIDGEHQHPPNLASGWKKKRAARTVSDERRCCAGGLLQTLTDGAD